MGAAGAWHGGAVAHTYLQSSRTADACAAVAGSAGDAWT